MPDDIIDTKVAEQASDKDFGDGFKETPEAEGAVTTKPEVKADDKPADKPATDAKAENKAPVEDGKVPVEGADKAKAVEKKPEDKTAQERMEDRSKADPAAVAAKDPDPAVDPSKEVTPAAAAKPATEAKSGWIEDLIKLPEVAETKVGVAGKEMTIAEFAEEYPEAIGAPVAIAKVMIEQALQGAEERHATEMQSIRGQVEVMQFWEGVNQAHSDGRKVAASPEFKAWRVKQSPLVEKLIISKNVEDAVSVLDAFKESLAKDVKKGKDKIAGEHKTAKDALHGDSLRGVGGAGGLGTQEDRDDFDAGFSDKK